jgi:hypothetical protein
MTIVRSWLRLELRRRWRSLTVLALLVAVAGAAVMAAIAGARRGASAQERLDARTLPATAMVLPNTWGFDWAPIRALPEVEAMSNFVVDYTMTGVDVPSEVISFPYTDREFLNTIERPVLFSGRAPDPNAPDEAAVTRQFVKHFHKGVGDTVTIVLSTPREVVTQTGSGPHGEFTGPRVTLHIVGVGESSPSWGIDSPGNPGGLLLSAGLYEKYPANIAGPPGVKNLNYINAIVRLRGGEAAIPRFARDLARVTGRDDIEVSDLIQEQRIAQHHIAFESRCLVAFAVAAFVAALFLIGQAIARYAAASTEELRTLRALGMTPRQSIVTASAAPFIVGVLGAIGSIAGAVAASRWLPYGTAGLLEPSPGISWDWAVFAPGAGVVAALVALGAAAAAWGAVVSARREGATRRSAVAMAASRGGLPVPIVIGTRFALERGRGRTAVPVRPALVGAIMGVLGVLAAFTFSRGVADAASHPARFGQTFQLASFVGINGEDFVPTDKMLAVIRDSSQTRGVDDARTAVATRPDGKASVSLWAYSTGSKAMPVVVLSGRMVETADEVVLAPRTLDALRLHVGDRIQLVGDRNRLVTFTIVGSGLVPSGPHNGYADGGWVTQHGYDRLFRSFKFHLVLVTLRSGVDNSSAAHTLTAAVSKADSRAKGFGIGPPDPLPEVAVLREVRGLPVFLGLFLALLAVGAVGHALATAVRRRSHDLAVLRALGMTQWQCRWVVVTQASVLAVVGAVFGVPLGLAVGRSVWRVVADYTPIQYVSPTAMLALALVAPAALLIANLLAAWPGRRAARLRIAHVLRAE